MLFKMINQIFYLFSEYLTVYMFIYIFLSRLNFIFNLKYSLTFICFISIFFTIFFKNFLVKISEKLKNTLFFNFLLFYHLTIKNYIYQILFEFFQKFENYPYRKVAYFLLGFNISLYPIIFFNYMFNYHQNLLLILLLLNTLLHYIQSQFIFNFENIQNIFKQKEFELDYNFIQKMLKIENNNSFNENKKFTYIQKRYIISNKAKQKFVDNIFLSLSSLGLGTLLGAVGVISTMKTNESNVKTNEENIRINEENAKINAENVRINSKRLELDEKRLELDEKKELHQFFKDLIEKNVKDNLTLNQKINEQNNSYFFKKDNTLDIDYLKKEIANNEKVLDSLSLKIYKNNQQSNDSNLTIISDNINKDNNLITSVFENIFL